MKSMLPAMLFAILSVGAGAARAQDAVCGDVNDSGSVNASDSLLVLRKGVGQDVDLTCDCTPEFETRFDTSGPTILDNQTGLEWDKKDGADGNENPANPHDVDNGYAWTANSPAADGPAFSDYLSKLNGVSDGICYAGHCDWRLPTKAELETLVDPVCNIDPPCVVDPALLPTKLSPSWTNETLPDNPAGAWYVRFDSGTTSGGNKTVAQAVRAVRNR
jgi:hypothetical protein